MLVFDCSALDQLVMANSKKPSVLNKMRVAATKQIS